jgi:PAS domain S-box-containing protein
MRANLFFGPLPGDDQSLLGHFLFSIALLLFALVLKWARLHARIRPGGPSELALHRQIINHAAEAMMLTDAAQRIVSVNHAFEQTTGYKAEEVLGRTPTMLSAGHNGLIAHRNIWDFVAENGDWHGEVWDRRKDGSLYPKQMRIKAIFDERGLASHFVAAFSDVSEAKAQAERLDYLARHDQLTNLPNRLALDKYLGNLLDSAVPGINRLALLIIDLDNFKTVNDSLGHHAGDRLLADLAGRLGAEMDHTSATVPPGRRRIRRGGRATGQ